MIETHLKVKLGEAKPENLELAKKYVKLLIPNVEFTDSKSDIDIGFESNAIYNISSPIDILVETDTFGDSLKYMCSVIWHKERN